jgi:hypothetical protein
VYDTRRKLIYPKTQDDLMDRCERKKHNKTKDYIAKQIVKVVGYINYYEGGVGKVIA